MTNPTPDHSIQLKFDSLGPVHQSIGRLNLTTSSVKDSLIAPSQGPGMEGKIQADASIEKKLDDNGPQKRSADETRRTPKVSFKMNEKGEIAESVHDYIPEEDMVDEEVWWTDDELDKLLTEAMLVAEHFTNKRKDWQNKIIFMLKSCKKCDKENPTPLKASDLEFVVDSDARGLELYIHPIFQKNRVKAIKSVVSIQKELDNREKQKGKKDLELRLKVLKNQSMKATMPAKLLAKTMADGDARIIQEYMADAERNPSKQAISVEEPATAVAPVAPEPEETVSADAEQSKDSENGVQEEKEVQVNDKPVSRPSLDKMESLTPLHKHVHTADDQAD
jgi:hypothetical protein